MPIDNPALLAFVNESIRPVADRLAALLPLPDAVLDACAGQELAGVLGTTDAKLLQPEAWTDGDYATIPVQVITGSDSGGRAPLTNHHVIGILRVLAVVKGMKAENPALGPLVGAVAVNPRA